ncbi:MAG: phosphatase PAP2 family protein [Deltaproteobacteria bacterium]|nr:phosphatase PAP2 family protein [Deltaproteobacteria bacterium]
METNTVNKRNILIFIPIFLLGIFFLLFFDTRIWLAAKDLIPRAYYYIPKLISKRGLNLFYAIFAALFVYGYFKKNSRLTGLCFAYLKAQLIFSFGVVRFLKIVLGRTRPRYGSEFTFFSLDSHFNSFPSGHSADAFVSGVFLYYLLKQSKYANCRFLPLIYAFLIAISRVFVSAHFPSDVAAGMLIGILGAWFFISRQPDYSN